MEPRPPEELQALREQVLDMGQRVQEAVASAVQALATRDSALALRVIDRDEAIDQAEIDVDRRCLDLLEAGRLQSAQARLVAMSFKMNGDLERIGDLAVNIAHRTRELLQQPTPRPVPEIPEMARITQGMLRDSLLAFANSDASLARDVCGRDDGVDSLNDRAFCELLARMVQDPSGIPQGINLIFIARFLERIADHATNIAEDVAQLAEGRSIKHRVGLDPVGGQPDRSTKRSRRGV